VAVSHVAVFLVAGARLQGEGVEGLGRGVKGTGRGGEGRVWEGRRIVD